MKKNAPALRISPDLSLPIDTVTSTIGDFGRRRTGKTYKAKLIAEEMLAMHQQIVVIDPTDAWWGLRSSADGHKPGYPITIFGGRHADLPLLATAGEELADAIATDDFSAIFSLKGMSKADEQRFLYSFLERLYRKNPQKALHLFMDEADVYAPQQPYGDEARTLGACQNIVRRGGVDGIGATVISQRPAVVSKGLVTQCETLIALKLSHPADLKQIQDWVDASVSDKSFVREMIASLPRLKKGTAWIISPHDEEARDIRALVTFRELRTFDSSRTPKVGEKRRAPRVLSKVDLQQLAQRIAATVAHAKENDPKQLKAELARLRKEVSRLEAQAAVPAKAAPADRNGKPPKVIERTVIKDSQLSRIEHLIGCATKVIEEWDDKSANAHAALEAVKARVDTIHGKLTESVGELVAAVRGHAAALARTAPPSAPKPNNGTPARTPEWQRELAKLAVAAPPEGGTLEIALTDGRTIKILPAMRRILDAIALLEMQGDPRPSKTRTAIYAHASPSSSAYTNNLGALRTAQLIEYPAPGHVALTDEGRKLADTSRAPQTTEELHAFVRNLVGPTRWRILAALIEHGDAMAKAELAVAAGASGSSSAYTNNLGSLRTLGFLDYPKPGLVGPTDILLGN